MDDFETTKRNIKQDQNEICTTCKIKPDKEMKKKPNSVISLCCPASSE